MNLALAPGIAAVLEGARWHEVASGRWSRVWRCTFDDGRAPLAVKATLPEARHERAARAQLRAEADRLAWAGVWLAPRGVPVAELVAWADPQHEAADAVLVTRWLDGEADLRLLGSSERATAALGEALALVHRVAAVGECPFDASLEARLAEAEARVEAGLVDTAELPPALQRYSPRELLDRVRAMAAAAAPPGPDEVVVLHGDLCVTNVLVDGRGTPSALLDWGRAGVGDRHADLAVTARSVVRNFGGEALPGFFAAVGGGDPDPLRLELYALLEELA